MDMQEQVSIPQILEKNIPVNSKRFKIFIFLKNNWTLLLVVLYIFFPIDFIPDAIPFLGIADDSSLIILELLRRWLEANISNGSNNKYLQKENLKYFSPFYFKKFLLILITTIFIILFFAIILSFFVAIFAIKWFTK